MLSSARYFKLSPQGKPSFRERFAPPVYFYFLVFIMLAFALILQYLFTVSDAFGIFGVKWSVPGHISQFVEEWPQKTGLGQYPSSFTRGIEPKPIHSHNDYWQKVPLYLGISVGAVSTEADVYARDGDLLVAHEETAISPNRTFRSLYVNPIVDLLERQNPTTKYANNTRCGVFDELCSQTLYLWVDLKTGAEETWPLVAAQLEPLRKRNWLTKWDGETIIPGPVTVIGTGNSNWDVLIVNQTRPRDYFVDAPLLSFGTDSEKKHPDGTPLYDHTSSPFATTSLMEAVGNIKGAGLSSEQLQKVEGWVQTAKDRGIQVRFWETPNWSTKKRHNVWRQLMDIPVGLLGADDLEDAAFGDW
ncbi:Altered inheritance of mitochondria protein 6 [Orbilia ellipsospora]|uniref:Altered inheritance of mitochondria protein 6 n=1 Tax=Orbilia ellipsospora TaxID=2528407 RepID=A0AAV9XQU9_9PEZI